VIRDATHYGAWSAILAFATVVGLSTFQVLRNGSFSLDAFFLVPAFLGAFATFVIAFLGWALLHRWLPRSGWIGYGLLATSVVVVTQLLIALPFAVLLKEKPLDIVRYNAVILIEHGWYTVPIALAGTALFVPWMQRRATAPLSPVDRVDSRS